MASLVWSVQRFVNSLLPFATPGTPVYQDVIHTIALCTVLYYLPVLAEKIAQARNKNVHGGAEQAEEVFDEHFANQGRPNDEEPAQQQQQQQPGAGAVNIDAAEHGIPAGQNAAPPPQAGGNAPDHQPALRRPRENVGAKKAKSLARKEQRRAHFEFVREQAAHERAVEQSTREQREAEYEAMVSERGPRWRAAQQKLEEEHARRKAERLRREQVERDRRIRCEELVKERLLEERCIDLQDIAEEVFEVETEKSWEEMNQWVANLVKAIPGVLGRKMVRGQPELTMLTAAGFIARIDNDIMQEVYAAMGRMAQDRHRNGLEAKVTMQETSHILEQLLMEQSF